MLVDVLRLFPFGLCLVRGVGIYSFFIGFVFVCTLSRFGFVIFGSYFVVISCSLFGGIVSVVGCMLLFVLLVMIVGSFVFL